MAKTEILKYLAHGYDLDYSVRQAKSAHLHRLDPATDRAAKSLDWWCELHQEAVERIAQVSDKWFRPSEIGLDGKPEILRDLLSVGVIEAKHTQGNSNQSENQVCLYRKSLNYLAN